MADTLFLSSSWQSDLLLPLRDTFQLPDLEAPQYIEDDSILPLESCPESSPCWKGFEDDGLSLLSGECSLDGPVQGLAFPFDQEIELQQSGLLLGPNNNNYSPAPSVSTAPSLSSVFTADLDTDTLEDVTTRCPPELEWCYELESDHEEGESDDSQSRTVSVDSQVESKATPGVAQSCPQTNPSPRQRTQLKFDRWKKPWAEMDLSEKIAVTEDLTQIVSSQMGLREQLDVIRLINPTASVTPTDKEFVIDLSCLTDVKLQLVRDYINKHKSSARSHGNGTSQGGACRHYRHKSRKGSKGQQCRCVNDSDSGSVTSLRQSPTTTTNRRRAAKENRVRRQKEYRQGLKERRSGLFRREEVLSLSVASDDKDEDEDDLDIVT